MNKTIKKLQITGLLIFALIITISATNCSRASKTLAEIGDEKITLGEFEKQYLKTIGNVDSARAKSMEDKKTFLNLYINFRLKVKDARERGLLKTPEMQKEIEEYKKNLAPTYLIDKEVVDPELKKLYDRKKEEVRASHILISLAEHPTPQDSIAAYQKASANMSPSCVDVRVKNVKTGKIIDATMIVTPVTATSNHVFTVHFLDRK